MATAKKATAKKATANKTAARKTTAKTSAAAKKTASKAPAKKSAAKKVAAKQTATGTAPKKTAAAKKTTGRKYGPKASEDVREEMHEFKRGQLRIGKSGIKVTNPKQAIAIGLAKARREGGKVPPNPHTGH